MKRYVMLDRDGTIIVDKHYLHDPDGVELLPGAIDGLKRMVEMGFGIVVLTNQSGVGRGYYPEAEVHAVHQRLSDVLHENGITVEGYFLCPHAPDEQCDCRKPAIGLVQQAVDALKFDTNTSYMIGDKACDVDVGLRVGAVACLVRTGKGREQELKCGDRAAFVGDTLLDVAMFIDRNEREAKPEQ